MCVPLHHIAVLSPLASLIRQPSGALSGSLATGLGGGELFG